MILLLAPKNYRMQCSYAPQSDNEDLLINKHGDDKHTGVDGSVSISVKASEPYVFEQTGSRMKGLLQWV